MPANPARGTEGAFQTGGLSTTGQQAWKLNPSETRSSCSPCDGMLSLTGSRAREADIPREPDPPRRTKTWPTVVQTSGWADCCVFVLTILIKF